MYQPNLARSSPLQMQVTRLIAAKTHVAQGLPTPDAVRNAVTAITSNNDLSREGIYLGQDEAHRIVGEIMSKVQTLEPQKRFFFDLRDSSRSVYVPLSISRGGDGYEIRIVTSKADLLSWRHVCKNEGANTGLISAKIYVRIKPIEDTFIIDFNLLGWLLAAGLPIKERPEDLVNHFKGLIEGVDERGEFKHPYTFLSMPDEGLMTSVAPTWVGRHQTWSFRGGLMQGQLKYFFLNPPEVPFIPGVSIKMSQSQDLPMDEVQESRTSRVYFKLINLLKHLFPRASI